MAKLIEQPEQFKTELKDKWLDYYEANRSWLKPLVRTNSNWQRYVQYEEGEIEDSKYQAYRPNSYFILGIVNILEPEIQGLCNFVPPTTPDNLIDHLGLNFDPEIELQKRPEKEITPTEYLNKIREEIKT